jgi:hypothetical protein
LVGEIGAGDPPPLAVRKPPEVVEDTEIAGGVGTGSAEDQEIAGGIGSGFDGDSGGGSVGRCEDTAGSVDAGLDGCGGVGKIRAAYRRPLTGGASPEVAAIAGGLIAKAAEGSEVALHLDPTYGLVLYAGNFVGGWNAASRPPTRLVASPPVMKNLVLRHSKASSSDNDGPRWEAIRLSRRIDAVGFGDSYYARLQPKSTQSQAHSKPVYCFNISGQYEVHGGAKWHRRESSE